MNKLLNLNTMSDFNTDQSFAKRLLKSQGWTEGSGLGKNSQGIVDPVKPSLKFDTTGVGHDPGKEFTDHWWAKAYNQAAQNIQVEHNDDGSVDIKSKKLSKRKKKKIEKKVLYSGFIKSATLNDGALTSISKEEEGPENPLNDGRSIPILTDEELFAACDGLTAHKGARHGHSMSAKYKRLAELDKQLMKSIEEKKRKKK